MQTYTAANIDKTGVLVFFKIPSLLL